MPDRYVGDRIPVQGGGSGAAIGNDALYSQGGAGAGLGAYGSHNAGVVNQKKPRPFRVQPDFPLVTNQPGPLTPPPKPNIPTASAAPYGRGVIPTNAMMPYGRGNGPGSGPLSPVNGPQAAQAAEAAKGEPIWTPIGLPQRYAPVATQPAAGAAAATPSPATDQGVLRTAGGVSGTNTPAAAPDMNAAMRFAQSSLAANSPNYASSLMDTGFGASPNLIAPAADSAGNMLAGGGPNYSSAMSMYGPATATIQNEPGSWHNPGGGGNDLEQAMATGMINGIPVPGMGGGGGGFADYGGGGGGGDGIGDMGGGAAGNPDLQAYIDAMNKANEANRARQNNISSGYEAMKDWIASQMGDLGEQQRKDVNTTFDKEKGRLTQDMISRGLTASTVLDNMQKGNERTRGESLARLSDQLKMNQVNTTLPVWGKELDFLNSINENAPDPALMAQLLQNAAAGNFGQGYGDGGGYGGGGGYAGGGGGAFVDMSGAYDQSGMGGMGGYGGGFYPMMGGGSQLVRGGRTVPVSQYIDNRAWTNSRIKRPTGPMLFSPDMWWDGAGTGSGSSGLMGGVAADDAMALQNDLTALFGSGLSGASQFTNPYSRGSGVEY